jgi:Xaa-Pro aminopeptidase
VVAGDGRATLFCAPKDLEREIWDGYRLGPEAAPGALGVDEAFSIGRPGRALPKLLENRDDRLVSVRDPQGPGNPHRRLAATRCARACATARCAPSSSATCAARARRDAPGEGRARAGHHAARRADQRPRPRARDAAVARMLREGKDVREYHLDAELLHEFRFGGSQYPAYSSIVAAGANACVLHYRADAAPVRSGELVLIDAGCELDGYASDITRTFPADGKFTGPQRALYDLVLASAGRGCRRHQGRRRFTDPHEATVRCSRRACWTSACSTRTRSAGRRRDRQARLLPVLHAPHRPLAGHGRARLRQLRRAHARWARERAQGPAVERVIKNRPSRILQPGMVLTIEPGIYVRPADGRARTVPQHRHPHRGRRDRHGDGLRTDHARRAGEGG